MGVDVDFLERFILVFSTLFVLVDPIGTIPSFLSLTKGYSNNRVKLTILKSCIFGAALLLVFSLIGPAWFHYIGLNMDAFKAGGGLLLLITALEMIRGKGSSCKCSPQEMAAGESGDDISFVPLGIPLLSGPGAITSIVVFSNDPQTHHLIHFLTISVAVLMVFVISYFVLRSSEFFKRLMGDSGISVLQRIMGLILAALSIQFIIEGATKFVLATS